MVTLRYPPCEAIQSRRPGQRPRLEHSVCGRSCLHGNVLSMQVTEAQADDVQFLGKDLDDLTSLAVTLGRRRAKVEASKMVCKWDEAGQLLLLPMP